MKGSKNEQSKTKRKTKGRKQAGKLHDQKRKTFSY